MEKEFFPYNQVRDNAIILANTIYNDGFVPDVIYVLLRGGAYLGNVISEYFKMIGKGSHPTFYAAVAAKSYSGFNSEGKVRIEGWTYPPEYLRTGDKVLVVDDIFDTGLTLNVVVDHILSKGISRDSVKIAVHDYKVKLYNPKQVLHQPDYYCRKHILQNESEDKWIHYLSHELAGLTDAEWNEHYIKNNRELEHIYSEIKGAVHGK